MLYNRLGVMRLETNVFVVGFGNVGKELVKLLLREGEKYGIELVGVSASRGSVLIGGPADKVNLLKLIENNQNLSNHPSFKEGVSSVEAALVTGADVALIVLPPSYETGEPNTTIYKALVEAGISIITADKTVLARDYAGFMNFAKSRGVYVGYRATVAAGTPAIDVARGLRGREVSSIRAVLNASSNYILGLVEEGLSFHEAITKAKEAKLLEPDHRIDTHGYDAAAKITILANTLGYKLSMNEVERVPIESYSEKEIRESLTKGMRVKQVALADFENKVFKVYPEKVGARDPLYRAEKEGNIIVFKVEGENIVLEGPAGPAWRTARTMVTDLLEYIEILSYY